MISVLYQVCLVRFCCSTIFIFKEIFCPADVYGLFNVCRFGVAGTLKLGWRGFL